MPSVDRRWLVLAMVVAARVAAADPEPIRITYDAPAECPAESDAIARLNERAPVTRVASGPVRTFALAITRDAEGFHGELAVHRGDDAPAVRDVTAASCDDAVTALVLVAALAIEERTPAPAIVAPPPPPAPVHTATPWRFAAGAGVALYTGMTPSARLGVPLYLDARRGHLELRATFDTTTSDDLQTASFRWTEGRVEGCPYAWTLGRIDLAPCAGVQIGALTGTGMMLTQASSTTRPWLAPEAAGRIGVRLGRFELEAEGTAALPLVRDLYYIGPMTTVHQVPVLTYGVATSIAIAFR
jgi:hypothetical protein